MQKRISDLKFEDVLKVYSGKEGCRCGCLGQYRTSKVNSALANADCGYEQTINDAQVRQVLAYMQGHVSEVELDDNPKYRNFINITRHTIYREKLRDIEVVYTLYVVPGIEIIPDNSVISNDEAPKNESVETALDAPSAFVGMADLNDPATVKSVDAAIEQGAVDLPYTLETSIYEAGLAEALAFAAQETEELATA